MKRLLKWTAIALTCGFLLLQFSRPARTNPVADESRALEASLHVTPEVKAIFARACDDVGRLLAGTNHFRIGTGLCRRKQFFGAGELTSIKQRERLFRGRICAREGDAGAGVS